MLCARTTSTPLMYAADSECRRSMQLEMLDDFDVTAEWREELSPEKGRVLSRNSSLLSAMLHS